MKKYISQLFTVLPALIFMTLMNVIIVMCVAGETLIQLISNGMNRYLALAISIIIAIVINTYISYNHLIKNYITKEQTK